MRHTSIFYALLLAIIIPFTLASCSEESGEVDEYPNWKEQNETTFSLHLDEARSYIAEGRDDYAIYNIYSQDGDVSNDSVIIVQKLAAGTGDTPLYNDSVRVHFYSRLLPSTSYPNGMTFYKSYSDFSYDTGTSVPYAAPVNSNAFTDGVITALLNMKVGDHWVIYSPWQLSYGDSDNSSYSVPAYSTIITDLYLVGVYRAGTTVPQWK